MFNSYYRFCPLKDDKAEQNTNTYTLLKCVNANPDNKKVTLKCTRDTRGVPSFDFQLNDKDVKIQMVDGNCRAGYATKGIHDALVLVFDEDYVSFELFTAKGMKEHAMALAIAMEYPQDDEDLYYSMEGIRAGRIA